MTRRYPDVSPLFEARTLGETDPVRRLLLLNCAMHGCEQIPVINHEGQLYRLRHGAQGEGITIDAMDMPTATHATSQWLGSLHEKRPSCELGRCPFHPR